MKTRMIRNIALLALLLPVVTSCEKDFLEQEPKTSLSTEQMYADLDNVQPFLNGIYFKWRSTRVNRKGFFLMLGTDESQQGEYQVRTDADQGGLDKYDGFYSPENKPVAELWNIRWPVVVQATEAIYHLEQLAQEDPGKDSARIASYIGQASFYRGAVMLELATYWGALPVPGFNGTDILLSERLPLEETYGMIETDLLRAVSLLPENPSADERIPTLWAARALLGKMYISAPASTSYRDYNEAANQFEEIITNGGFSLAGNYADLWDPYKTAGKESIFTFFFNNTWPDTNEAQWYTGSRACSGNPTNYLGGYDMILPTEYSRTDVTMGGLWEDGDLRKNESIRYEFSNGNMVPSAFAGFGEDQLLPHIKKYEDIRLNGLESFYETGKNMYYIRYADVLLSYAECLNELGSTPEAVVLVNETVRTRAWGGTLPLDKEWAGSMSQQEFRDAILDERMRELCYEGWRRFDLLRTNQFTTLISERNRWANATGSISEKHMLYPIPNVEIKQNENLDLSDQNPGY